MKRGVVLLGILLIFLVLVLPLAVTQEADGTESDTDTTLNVQDSGASGEQPLADKAYECLENKIGERGCDKLSLEEATFSLLATGKCKTEVKEESSNDECWPKSGCNIKQTAQAVLGLSSVHSSTTKAQNWLISKTIVPSDIIWYLQIESSESTTCTVSYSGSSHSITIGDNKKINSGAGSCLSLSEGGWWLKVAPSCYEEEFEVSCDKSFLTTLLYKQQASSTIFVSEQTRSASAEGTTTEQINSKCFSTGSDCDYEGSLWATLVLDSLGEDVSSYMPYLVTMADDNQKVLPEAFLYLLTGSSDFRSDLLLMQKSNSYWDESGDKFYDTALALLPFQYEEPAEKTNSKDWLLEVQDKDGCWQGNIRNTAFILYSVWPEEVSVNGGGGGLNCEIDGGGYCMSEINCDGNILQSYDCSGVFVCCDTPGILDNCLDMGGEICASNEDCVSGTIAEAGNTGVGEICCIGGSCEIPSALSECESYGGTCRSSCRDNEEENQDDCDFSGDVCCVESSKPPSGNYGWIWVLLILIALVVAGIIFRDKLRSYWFKIKSKFGKSGGRKGPKRPGFPPSRMPPRAGQRRILPPSQDRAPLRGPLRPRPKGELDEVLKKLRDMGK